jgi:predicted amidohydrolase YtcJ
MLSPYLDAGGHATGGTGISFVDPEALKEHVVRLHREGFQVHFHALGDRAVRESLDAVEAAVAAAGPRDLRHHLAHVQVVHPDDVPRFAALDAVANCQPLWARNEPQMTELTIPFLGPSAPAGSTRSATCTAAAPAWRSAATGRCRRRTPWRSCTRRSRGSRPARTACRAPFLPEQRLSLRDAVHALTLGSAYVNHAERDTGSIEPGKYADLTVLTGTCSRCPRGAAHRQGDADPGEGRQVHESK